MQKKAACLVLVDCTHIIENPRNTYAIVSRNSRQEEKDDPLLIRLLDGAELGLGALLAGTATTLLSGCGTTTLLLADDNANKLALESGLLLSLSLDELGIRHHVGRRVDGIGRGASGTGDALGVVIEGIREEEVVVGEVRSRALFTVRLERVTTRPGWKGTRGIARVKTVGSDIHGARRAHGAVGSV